MQQIVCGRLGGRSVPEVFGFPIAATAQEDVARGQRPRHLIGAADIGLKETVARIHALEGLGPAARIDRPAHGIIGRRGSISPGLGLDGVEVSCRATLRGRQRPCASFRCTSWT